VEASIPRPLKPMSEEQLKAFLEAVKADAGLQERLKAAEDADDVAAIAKAAGFAISVEALKGCRALQAELSDEELEGVAGGLPQVMPQSAYNNCCIYNNSGF
jgi:predicted ribosomally synthesized peptide with nif11-like leader